MRKVVLNFSLFHLRTLHRALAALLLAAFPFQQALEAASPTLPSGGAFTAGSGSIANSANAVTIHQATNRGVIDWRSFSIGTGGSVLFQNGSGATLNRVTGGQMSLILGSLQATGTVYLINPQGVIIGPNGTVKTGGDFVASTLNLPNSLFLSGGALVFDGKSKAFVKNLGAISSTGGSVFLIADKVVNKGTISAPNGSVGMAAGEQILLADSGSDERIFVSAGKGDVTNKGTIAAAQAELKANGGNIYALAGNNGGGIRATGTATRDGHVWLVSNSGTTKVSGNVAAQNVDGRGGSIETSGHAVDFGDASIKTGVGGTWLVDPVDLTIDASAASTIQTSLNGGTNVTESTSASSSSGYGTTAAGNGDINVASSIAWNSAASLTLSAYRNINVQNAVTISNGGTGGLTLHADNAATGIGTVIFSGTGNVHFTGSGNVDLFYHPAGYPTATSYTSNVTMGTGAFTPYMTVDTATDLQNINSNLSGKYALNTDIDASSIANFVPIAHGASTGDNTQGFSGLFDGQGHTIDHLTVNDSSDLTAGLFSQTSSSGIIRNVGLKNASVTSTASGTAVGGLVGENYGNISASYVSGSVAGNGLGNTVVGGLVGENDGTISNTYSTASVSGMTTSSCNNCVWIGGLVGDNGLVNFNTATISNSLAVGSVTSSGSGTASIGGFAGENDASITGSYFDTQSTGQSVGDAFCNLCTSDSVTSQTTAQLQTGSLPSGFSSSIWRASAGSYPKFIWEPLPGLPVSGIVYNGATPLGSVTVVGLANGTSFGSTTTNGSGAYTLTAPSGTTGILTYLTGGYTGNTFSNNGTTSFTGVDIYTNSLRLINVTNNNYSGIISALSTALGGNSGSNFLFSIGGGNLTLGAGANFAVISSVATNIDQSIAGTGTVLVQSSGNLTINASNTISATGTGTPLTLVAGGMFINNSGVNALSTSGGGRWLVYSQNPANDTVGSLSYGFKQYNATYGSATVAQSTGNGLLYTLAPSLTPSLIGSTSKTYDAGTTAAVASANLTSTGALTGDTITLSAAGATYADKNQGSGKSVTATGVSVASATDGTGATVYGYQFSSTSASGNIGIINPAMLTYTANTASRAYGAANPAFSGTVTGFVGGETQATATTGTLSFGTPATATSSVGNYAINGTGLTANNGNYSFQQAGANALALTINPATLLYSANAASKTYGDSNPAFSGTVTGFQNGDTQATATTGTLAFTSPATNNSNVGSYAINGSGLTANSNYTLQQAAGNATALTINPAVLTYTANTASRAYGASDPAFSGAVTGFVNSDTQGSATTGTLSFTTPATAGSSVGNYAINGSGLTANNGNYTFQQAGGNATALSITPAQLLYTANAASRAYGSSNPAFTGTVTGFVNSDTQASATSGTLSFSSSATTTSNVGSYAVNGAGLTVVGGNYTLAQAPGNATALIINPATLLYTSNAASKTYGDSNPAFSGTVSGFVNGDTQATATTGTLAFTSPATSTSNVGSYAINGSGLTANSNYTLQQAAGNATALTINPASLTYTANAASRAYGASNPAFTGTVTGFVNSDTQASATTGTLSFTSPATTTDNVGSYAINGSGLSANSGNYTFQQAAGNATALTIDPAHLLYTANTVSRTYGGSNPSFTGTVTGFVNGDTQGTATTGTLSFSSSATTASNAGSYAINGSGLTAVGGNYTLAQAPGNATALTINPAVLTYTANSASRTYGDANPSFSGTLSGFVNGETQATATTGTAAFTSPADAWSNVGNYAINGSGLTANNGNYTFQQAAGNAAALTINPALLTYTADAASRTYGSANPAFTGAVVGFVNGETIASATTGAVAFTSPATTSSNVGTYSITGSGLAANNGNYTFQQAAGNTTALTINPAQLLYTANAVSRTYGDANPALSGTVTGFVNGDTQASATTGAVSFSTTATNTTGVGSYAINGSGLSANSGNYVLAQDPGNATALTINPAALTASVLANDKVYDATTAATGQVANLSGVLNGDDVSVNISSAAFRFSDKNVGNGKTVTETGATLSGVAAPNYTLAVTPGTASITPATVVAAVSASDKEYDTTTAASGYIAGLSGVVGNDVVQADSSHAVYAFSDKNAGTNKTVLASGITLTGADAGNYTLGASTGLASITPAAITTSISANNKTYDGTLVTTGSLGPLTGVLGHDTVTLNSANTTYAFLNPNAGTAKTVTATGAALAGFDAGNYHLSIQNGLADINPVPVTVSIEGANRLVGALNPRFTAVYTGGPVPGVSIPDLLSSIWFSVDATPASGPGTYTITGTSSYPNVDLTVLPGTLTINFASTPKIDPSMVTAKRIDPPPLSVAALVHVIPTNSIGLLQVSFSTDWSSLGNSGSQVQPLASSSFLTSGTSSTTYQGGIRPW